MACEPVRRAWAQADARCIHYLQAGSGRPLLLLHQSPSSSAMWLPLMPLLAADGFHVLAPDLPGFGASEAFAQPPALADFAAAMGAFCDALALARIDVLGHHTGAAVGLELARREPDRVGALVLWGIPLLEDTLRERLAAERSPVWDADGTQLLRAWQRRRELSGAAFTPELGVRCLLELLQCGERLPWGHWAVARADMRALLRQVRHPVLAICGERDPVWPRAREAAALLARGTFAHVPGAGLDVVDELPQQVRLLTREFVQRHRPAAG